MANSDLLCDLDVLPFLVRIDSIPIIGERGKPTQRRFSFSPCREEPQSVSQQEPTQSRFDCMVDFVEGIRLAGQRSSLRPCSIRQRIPERSVELVSSRL